MTPRSLIICVYAERVDRLDGWVTVFTAVDAHNAKNCVTAGSPSRAVRMLRRKLRRKLRRMERHKRRYHA